jgi:segregation and condensation protein B
MISLAQTLQAILFAAPEPVSLKNLSKISEHSEEKVLIAISELETALADTGLRLSQHDEQYRLVTAPEAAEAIAALHQYSFKNELSKPALETLAIIAYQGPISRSKIEEIRGIGSEQMIRNLLQRNLITENGRTNEPGKASQYSVTEVFLDTVGITKLSDLPPLPEAG